MANAGGAHFTTSSYGLLTDTINGGLKVDLSLGLEMDEADFKSNILEQWRYDSHQPIPLQC